MFKVDILVVDDTSSNLEFLEEILTQAGYRFRAANDGNAAFNSIREKMPDLILLDIKMPGMDGFEVCRKLKADKNTNSVPVIFITVLKDEQSKLRAFQAGASDYITKPFLAEEVLTRVRMHLSNLELLKSERKFRHLFENSPLGKSFTRIDGTIEVNSSFCEMLGYTAEELENKNWRELTYPDDIWKSEDAVNKILQRKEPKLSFEKRYIHKDGSIVWAEVTTSAKWDEKGNPLFLTTSVNNITERKHSEAAIHESELRYRTILDLAADAIIMHDETGRILEVNIKACENLGYTRDEILGRSIEDIDPEAIRAGKGNLWKAILGGESQTFESHQVRKDGTSFPVEVTLGSVTLPQGRVILGIVRNIAERKRTEEELRLSEEKFRVFFEKNSAAIAIIDPDTTILMANDAYCQMSGYTRDEVVGMSWTKQIPPGDLERLQEYNRRRLMDPSDAPDKYEFRFLRKDGEIRYGLMSVTMTEIGRKIICSFTDITERRIAEELLKNSEEKFSKAFQNSPDVIIITAIDDGKIIDVNESLFRVSGMSREEAIGKTTIDLNLWNNIDDRNKFVELLLQKKRVLNFETTFRKKSGEIFTGLISGEIIMLQDLKCVLSMVHDITERKQAEDAARETEMIFSSMFYQSPVTNVITTPFESTIIDVNETFLKDMEYTREEVIGKTLVEVGVFDDLKDRDILIGKLKENGYVFGFESRFRTKTRKIIYGLISIVFIQIKGKPYQLSTVIDITDRKLAEEKIKKLNDKLEQKVMDRTHELENKNAELIRLNRLFVGRELRMVELKQKIREQEKRSDNEVQGEDNK